MRLIDANYVLEMLGIFNDRKHGDAHFFNGIASAREIIENAPTISAADVEPVVRCKNCVKWGKRDCKRNPCVIDISSMDEFCSDGERKAHMERSGSGEI